MRLNFWPDGVTGMTTASEEAVYGSLPRYQQVKHDLRQRILSGALKPGDQMPNEFALAEEFGVSRLTVNKAMGDLVRENYLVRQRGRGTFVSDRETQPDLLIHVVSNYASRNPGFALPAHDPSRGFSDHRILLGIIQACQTIRCQTKFVDLPGDERLRARPGCRPAVLMLDLDIPAIARMVENGCVVVVPYFPAPPELCSSVVTDWEAAFYDATQHLLRLGHRRVALLTNTVKNDVKLQLRSAGCARALREAGVYDPAMVLNAWPPAETTREALDFLLKLDHPPTALLATNDICARYAMRCLQERGLRVPEDMAVVGFDDDPEAEHCHPALTTCHPPHFECGVEAVNLLKKLARRELEGNQRVVIPSHLVIRESCGAKRAPTG